MNNFKILPVTAADAEELLEIYRPYITDTAVTFEYDVPSAEEFAGRIRRISARYPYIKLVDENGIILGYSYASTFKDRRAYDWSVETTIYLKPDCRHRGLGGALYLALEDLLRAMGILNMNACIAVPKGEDPYLTMDSIRFHEKLGYAPVGVFHDSGFKFGRWYDMIWMEKHIGPHGTSVQSVIPFPDLQLSDVLSEIKTAVQSHTSSKCI